MPRVATHDDVLPLEYPIVAKNGDVLTEIPINAGQVILTSFGMYNRCGSSPVLLVVYQV